MSSADMYWELTLPGRESSPPLSSFPKICKGGNPSLSKYGALFHSLGARYDTFVISFLSIVGREKSHGCSCSVYIDRTVFFRESLFHDPCVVTVGHVGYRYRIFAQGVYDESPVADTFGCRQFDFYVAVVWSKDFVIHLFAVGFVAKLAKKEEWYVSFLYLSLIHI